MPTAPYTHVETTPISLVGDLAIAFTPVAGTQTCVISRSYSQYIVTDNGDYAYGAWHAEPGDPVWVPVDPRFGPHWQRTEGYWDIVWVPPTIALARGEPSTVYANVVTQSAMVAGDTLIACWGQYTTGRASAYAGFVAKEIAQLPALDVGLAYGEYGVTPHLVLANALVQNDFADGTTACCPIGVEPKAEAAVIPPTFTSLRNAILTVEDYDRDQVAAVIQFITQPDAAPRYAIDGADRRFNDLSPSDPDSSIAAWSAAAFACAAYLPESSSGVAVGQTGNYRIQQNINAGTASYLYGSFSPSTPRGRVGGDLKGYSANPDAPSKRYTSSIAYTLPFPAFDPGDPPTYDTLPSVGPFVVIHTNPTIPPGPDLTTPPLYTGWHIDIPVDSSDPATGVPVEERCRNAFTHTYPWAWHAAGDAFTLHVKVTTAGTLWQFFSVTSNGTTEPPYTSTDLYHIFGLSADRNPFGLTRIVNNVGFNTNAIRLRRYFDLEATPDDVALTITGRSPDIVCLSDGTHLVFRTDGTNVQLSRIDDEGTVVETMASPGSGKLVGGHIDPAGLCLWEAHCTADTGSGDIVVRRNFDVAGIGATWETISGNAAGLPTSGYTPGSVPAQVPRLTGDSSELNLFYHDTGGDTHILRSLDCGATWAAV